MILPWRPYINEHELVVVGYNSEQNYTIPALVVVIVPRIIFVWRNFYMATVQCAKALRKACASLELLHMVSNIVH